MRLARFRVEDFRKKLATLESMRADAEKKLSDLEDSIERERVRSNDSDLSRVAFPSFLRSIDARRENLRLTLSEVSRERDCVESALLEAEEGLKGLELACEMEQRRLDEALRMRQSESEMLRHLRRHAVRA